MSFRKMVELGDIELLVIGNICSSNGMGFIKVRVGVLVNVV